MFPYQYISLLGCSCFDTAIELVQERSLVALTESMMSHVVHTLLVIHVLIFLPLITWTIFQGCTYNIAAKLIGDGFWLNDISHDQVGDQLSHYVGIRII